MTQIWLNGKIVDEAEATVSGLAHTLHYGVGVFEGVRSYETASGDGSVFRLRDHVERLANSARVCGLSLGFSTEELMDGCVEAIRAAGLVGAYLRPVAYQDDAKLAGLGASPPVHVAISAHPWGAYLGEEGLRRGIHVCLSTYRRAGAASGLGSAKICGQYVSSVLAKREALANGFNEALLMDEAGYVAEGTGENLFIIEDGVLVTPPKSAPILPGITRDTVLWIAEQTPAVRRIVEDHIPRDRLTLADEVFLTGTAAEVTPIRQVDQHVIGPGERGPITEAIQTTYFDLVSGRSDAPEAWRTTFQATATRA